MLASTVFVIITTLFLVVKIVTLYDGNYLLSDNSNQ
jgi:hypothetical protein